MDRSDAAGAEAQGAARVGPNAALVGMKANHLAVALGAANSQHQLAGGRTRAKIGSNHCVRHS
jgi:hypothetical protein